METTSAIGMIEFDSRLFLGQFEIFEEISSRSGGNESIKMIRDNMECLTKMMEI